MKQKSGARTKQVTRDTSNDLSIAIKAVSEKKAEELVALDLSEIASFTDYFLICSGNSTRHVQAIADEVVEKLREQGARPLHVEGYQSAQWVLIDYGDLVVHVFDQRAREFYDLERLWRDAKRVEIKESETA